jgi:cell division protein FtsI/penicillin-binding protein 2
MPAADVTSSSRAHRRPRPRTLGAAALSLALVVGGLTACGAEDTAQDDAEALATKIAEGLVDGDFTGVAFSDASPAEAAEAHAAIVAAVADSPHTVEVTDVVLDEEKTSGTATFAHTWDVSGIPWTYSTEAPLAVFEETWESQWDPALVVEGLVSDETLQLSRTMAPRADILGAGDTPIVTERPVRRVGVDKTRVEATELDATARTLAGLAQIDADAYAAKVAAAGEKAFVDAVTLRTEDPSYDFDAMAAIPGVLLVDATLPLAPTRDFAAPVLGRAGEATAEIVEESAGTIAAGDVTGLSGLQRQYDEQLRGTPGIALEAVSEARGARVLLDQAAVPGEPLRTTLDVGVQQLAEDILVGQTVPSAIVAIRPSTGEVLASASGTAGGGVSTATTGMYAPGSTFKIVTSLALLRSGLTADSPLDCSAEAVVDGRAFVNYPDYPAGKIGQIPLTDVIANSCNTALINASGQVTQADLASAGEALGLGLAQQPGPGVFTGSVPADAEGTEHAASMIGQGQVQASPMAMATVAASVAAGTTVRPTLLAQEADPVESDLPEAPAAPLTADEAAQLSAFMRAVVTDGGGSFLQDVPGEPVGAKTGTAQYGDGSTNHAWMIAVQGDLAVAVFVETGDYGSTTAGPLLEAFLDGLA